MKPSSTLSRSSVNDSAFNDLVDELTARLQAGESVDIDAYAAEHPGYAESLRRLMPALQVLADLSHSREANGAAPPDLGESETGTLGDFRLIREVGRGGMGVVYEAEQISLNRRVALKVLPFAATMDPRSLQRFKNEAKAAASLRHENIVHVYGVGCERGVHFYAMEFVEGQTLAQIIHGLWTTAPSGEATSDYVPGVPEAPTKPVAVLSTERDAPRGRAFFRQAAEMIAQAADAIEHAHALGIVHRDVKPGNLLLDAAGKVYVSDFGLARIGQDVGLTMTGDLVGTLRYMAPEQAMACHGLADHRVDVYGLGATLYELLTGRPAVTGNDKQEILKHIAFDEPAAPRRINKAIPVELETITFKSLAKNPAERYATAGDLAADLRRWLADQPITARRPTVRQRLGRWARRHPGWIALVGLAAGLLLAGAWAWNRETTQADAAARVVAAEADKLWESDRLPEALQAARRAADLLPRFGGDAALRRAIEERVADLQLLNRLDEARLESATLPSGRVEYDGSRVVLVQTPEGLREHLHFNHKTDAGHTNAIFRQAFQDYGVDVIGGDEIAVTQALRRRAVVVQSVAILAGWARSAQDQAEKERLGRLVDALDADPRRMSSRLLRALQANDIGVLKQLATEADVNLPPPAVLVRLADALKNVSLSAQAERLYRAGQQRYPTDLWINLGLAQTIELTSPDRIAETVRFFSIAAVLRPHYAIIHDRLGGALRLLGRLSEAESAYRRAIALRPDVTEFRNNLGSVLEDQGKFAEAETFYRKAISLSPDSGVPLINLAILLLKLQRNAEAEAASRRAIELMPDHAQSYNVLGLALRNQGRNAEAEAAWHRAVEINPRQVEPQFNLAVIFEGQGRLPEAEAAYRRIIEIQPDYYGAFYRLGLVLGRLERNGEAEVASRRMIELKPNEPEGHLGLAYSLKKQGRFDESLTAFRHAYELGSKRPNWKFTSAESLRLAEQMATLAPRLHSFLSGEAQPANATEQIAIAEICTDYKKLYATATRFYSDAFAAEPKLAVDPNDGYRYGAACAAIWAGTGQGEDAAKLDDAERSRLRKQGLDWLTALLAARVKQAETGSSTLRQDFRQKLVVWNTGYQLANVRNAGELAKLPEAERVEWQRFWADVAELLKRGEQPPAAEKPPPKS